MKWLLVTAGALVLVVGLVWLVGSFLPREHRATSRVRLRAAPDKVFALLTDVERFPSWRSDVKAVRALAPIGGQPAFQEDGKHGTITYAIEAREPPVRLVTRIADDSLPFGGTWTFTLEPSGSPGEPAGTMLSITEQGFIRPALFRALARFVFGYHATQESYAKDLGRALGEEVVVERVE